MSESTHRTWKDRKAAFKTPPPQVRDVSASQEQRRKKVSVATYTLVETEWSSLISLIQALEEQKRVGVF